MWSDKFQNEGCKKKSRAVTECTEKMIRNDTIYKNSKAKDIKRNRRILMESDTICTNSRTENIKKSRAITETKYIKIGKKRFIKIRGQRIQNRIVQNTLIENDIQIPR